MHRLPMTRDEDEGDAGMVLPSAVDDRRERECLMCHGQFPSAWSGERICPKCKGGSAWRQGFTSNGRCVRSARGGAGSR